MPKLDRVVLINSAGFDYLDLPVGGHIQVFGVNGHGKSTVLRSVLFFYVANNQKAYFDLPETKSDFVSYYLGEHPSYLIYIVDRGEGQPNYHIAVTRPAERIQFHFVDAPFKQDYYLDGTLIRSLEAVQKRLREEKCPFETVNSYEEFKDRIYGITSSHFAVFKPATRGSTQVGVLPRVLSGIFTVAQLEADKLKAALTCGVREHTVEPMLDLQMLKNQLQNFRRINRAVKRYLDYKDDAIMLVDHYYTQYNQLDSDRTQAILNLVSMAKNLPAQKVQLDQAQRVLTEDREQVDRSFEKETGAIKQVLEGFTKDLAVISDRIRRGEQEQQKYESAEIDRKAKELANLPRWAEEQKVAKAEYDYLTTAHTAETKQKEELLDRLKQSWTSVRLNFEEQRAKLRQQVQEALEAHDQDKNQAMAALEGDYQRQQTFLRGRRSGLDKTRDTLNAEYKKLGEMKEPAELPQIRQRHAITEDKRRKEFGHMQRLNTEIALHKKEVEHGREKLQREFQEERLKLEGIIEQLKSEREKASTELRQFDKSLIRFFQTQMPSTSGAAARTLNRDTLFHDASELGAKVVKDAPNSVWGIELSTQKLPSIASTYDRQALEAALQSVKARFAEAQDKLTACNSRFVVAQADFQAQATKAQDAFQQQLSDHANSEQKLAAECARLQSQIATVESQFQQLKQQRAAELESSNTALNRQLKLLQQDEFAADADYQKRKNALTDELAAKRQKVLDNRKARESEITAAEAAEKAKFEQEAERIEQEFQKALKQKGVDPVALAKAHKRFTDAGAAIQRIEAYREEVAKAEAMKKEFIDPLPANRLQHQSLTASISSENAKISRLKGQYEKDTASLNYRQGELNRLLQECENDGNAVNAFTTRYVEESGQLEREDITAAPFHRSGAIREYLQGFEDAHASRESISKQADLAARKFLNRFDPETLDREVLGFSPIHEHFFWYTFVGAQLKPFVDTNRIASMAKVQTQEFEQLIRNICAKNSAFTDGINQVRQVARLLEAHVAEHNFVDVLESIALKVERVDNTLIQTLAKLEEFSGLTFDTNQDLFGKRADSIQVEKAIETVERLLKEIDNYQKPQLQLTDYFEFQIRVKENGHDMGWRKSLDKIGSDGTDYLLKMLIYLSLIEVYRARAIDPSNGSIVHCILDETGILTPKYVKKVLDYAKSRNIILVTAGQAQQTTGFDTWFYVRKLGQRFQGQQTLRRTLKCN